MNPNWPRWMMASVGSYLKGIADNLDLPCLVESIDERTEKFMHSTVRVEVRITGPFSKHPTKGYYHLFLDVNVLLSSRNEGNQNAYDLLKYAGTFLAALDEPIGIWNFGNEEGDYKGGDTSTQVFLGCLEPRPGQSARLLNFGQVTISDTIQQIEVENKFELLILSE